MKDPIVTITARTGGEPDLRYLNDGTAVCAVRAAWSHDRPDGNGGWIEVHNTWSTVEWWGKAAEHTAELGIGSGDLIRVTGALYMDEFTRRDGTLGSTLKLRADGTPRVWPKKGNSGGGSGVGWTDQQGQGTAAPASGPENTPGRGAGLIGGHDDPPF